MIDLAVLVASIALGIKRLHDRDRYAWWLLLFFLGPVVFAGAGGAIMWAGASSVGMTEDWSLFPRLCRIGGFALGIWGLVEIGFLRGSAGYNRFGPNPLGKHQKPGLIFGPTENPLGKAGRKMGVERPVHRRAAIYSTRPN